MVKKCQLWVPEALPGFVESQKKDRSYTLMLHDVCILINMSES